MKQSKCVGTLWGAGGRQGQLWHTVTQSRALLQNWQSTRAISWSPSSDPVCLEGWAFCGIHLLAEYFTLQYSEKCLLEPMPLCFSRERGLIKKMGTDFFRVCCDRTRGGSFKLREGRFKLGIQKKFFLLRVVRHWHGLPRAVVDAPFLEALKVRLAGLCTACSSWRCPCSVQRGCTGWSLKVPSNPKYWMILWLLRQWCCLSPGSAHPCFRHVPAGCVGLFTPAWAHFMNLRKELHFTFILPHSLSAAVWCTTHSVSCSSFR